MVSITNFMTFSFGKLRKKDLIMDKVQTSRQKMVLKTEIRDILAPSKKKNQASFLLELFKCYSGNLKLYLSQHKTPCAVRNYKQSIPVATAEQFPISED